MSTAEKLNKSVWVVESVHDTRQVELIGDKAIRVPGTGELRECDHCGAGHEIHTTMRNLDTNETMVVGGSCARGFGKVRQVNKTFVRVAPHVVGYCGKKVIWFDPATGEEFETDL